MVFLAFAEFRYLEKYRRKQKTKKQKNKMFTRDCNKMLTRTKTCHAHFPSLMFFVGCGLHFALHKHNTWHHPNSQRPCFMGLQRPPFPQRPYPWRHCICMFLRVRTDSGAPIDRISPSDNNRSWSQKFAANSKSCKTTMAVFPKLST